MSDEAEEERGAINPGRATMLGYSSGHRRLFLVGSDGTRDWRVMFLGTRAFDVAERFEFAHFAVGDASAIELVQQIANASQVKEQDVYSFHTSEGAIHWVWAATATMDANAEEGVHEIMAAPIWDGGPTLERLARDLAASI